MYTLIGSTDFTLTRDGDEVVLTGQHEGDVTGAYTFSVTQNTGTVVATTTVITEGESDETPSSFTMSTYLSTGASVSTTIMYASNIAGANLATELANEWPSASGYSASADDLVVTLTADSPGVRQDNSITNIESGTTGNLNADRLTLVTTQQGRTADTVIDTDVPQDSVTIVKADGEQNGTRTVTFDPATLASEVTDLLQDELEEIYMIVSQPNDTCLLYTSPSPRDRQKSRMPSSA